ncbi:MAG TPA: hypothetical protein VIL65_04255 [Beijerinckiaceae bacterium]|jgi:hypothetical protein
MIELVSVQDHKAFGKLVVQWSLQPDTRPADLAAFKQVCAGLLTIPDRIKEIAFVDQDQQTLLIRVPNKEMVEEAVVRFTNQPQASRYPAPSFYEMMHSRRPPPALDILYSRIADYTISQCA